MTRDGALRCSRGARRAQALRRRHRARRRRPRPAARARSLALLGDNGAGKSTLIKALSGVHQLDEGEIRRRRRAGRLPLARGGPRRRHRDRLPGPRALRQPQPGRQLLHRARAAPPALARAARAAAQKEMAEGGASSSSACRSDHGPDRPSGLMSGGQRQAIAVARAVAFAAPRRDPRRADRGARPARVRARCSAVRRLPEQGVSVILISHNLEHVMQVADRAVVLRQGRHVGEANPTPEHHQYLVGLIVGAAAVMAPLAPNYPVHRTRRNDVKANSRRCGDDGRARRGHGLGSSAATTRRGPDRAPRAPRRRARRSR